MSRPVNKNYVVDEKAGEGNRTLVSSLEGYSFTIKLHPRGAKLARPIADAKQFLKSQSGVRGISFTYLGLAFRSTAI